MVTNDNPQTSCLKCDWGLTTAPLGIHSCAIGDSLLRYWGRTLSPLGNNSSESPINISSIPNGSFIPFQSYIIITWKLFFPRKNCASEIYRLNLSKIVNYQKSIWWENFFARLHLLVLLCLLFRKFRRTRVFSTWWTDKRICPQIFTTSVIRISWRIVWSNSTQKKVKVAWNGNATGCRLVKRLT